ncbi:hypothetical protein ABIA30_003127 [Mycobacterium sp. MAA66]|uniref:hypothetical protein n=1 Tax=Mycobacterium sp. MAA66 TaxID=3156297 RepID=UPI003518D72E
MPTITDPAVGAPQPISTQIADSLAAASACRPLAGGRVYCEAEGSRITITYYTTDPETREQIVREFAATVIEVTA